MIKPFQINHQTISQPTSPIPLAEGARKVFEEASGVSDLFVPEVEDHYEDMAADFLEQWLVSSGDPFKADVAPAKTESAPAVAEKPDSLEPAPSAEPPLTTFSIGLDWQLSDGRKL
jgi:hypothetical protein